MNGLQQECNTSFCLTSVEIETTFWIGVRHAVDLDWAIKLRLNGSLQQTAME